MAVTIGITGGIGSGKTTVCKVFRLLGAPVFEADDAAKILYDTDAEIRSELIQLFGESIYNTEGYLDRKKLASLIFNDDN
ncbi:MAG: dephospho-CoA kinase, partial [Bacteroidales bacterium]|nr:dephospho-CoA kinase [Bacteroidales bacterium]